LIRHIFLSNLRNVSQNIATNWQGFVAGMALVTVRPQPLLIENILLKL
jgi:hypothetical protein